MEISTQHTHVIWYYLCKGVSYLFHPLLIPVWILALAFGSGVLPIHLSAEVRIYLLALVVVNTLLIPVASIVLMKLFRLIPDYSFATRHDRLFPLLITALCYGLCAWVLGSSPMLFLLRRMMFASMLCVLFAMLVTLRWQVSLHMTAIGAVTGMIFILLVAGYTDLIWLFCGAILGAGLLASARLYLDKHTPAQVGIGFFGGFAIAILVLLWWV